MPDRLFVGLSGSNPIFRISKPGRSVHSSNIEDFLFREDREVFRGHTSGSWASGGTGTADTGVSGVGQIVYVSLRCSDGTAPAHDNYFAVLINPTTLRLVNRRGARTIHFSVFGNPIT